MQLETDWRNREGKMAKVQEKWGARVPGYLWYYVGDNGKLGEDAYQILEQQFFPKSHASFGDIEVHRTQVVPGGGVVLRIRRAEVLLDEINLNGEIFPLYQAGYGGSPFDPADPELVRFCPEPTHETTPFVPVDANMPPWALMPSDPAPAENGKTTSLWGSIVNFFRSIFGGNRN